MEIWKDIEGFENKYQISNKGHVKSLNYNNTNKEKILSPVLKRNGLYAINLWKNNKAKMFTVGQLVAMHFLKKENDDDVVMHIGDKTNDNVNNLKYVSLGEVIYNKKQNKKKQIDVIDKLYVSGGIKEKKKKAKANGIKEHQLYKRLYEGWSLDEAINIPIERKERILNKRIYNYNGKYYSIKQLSKIANISERTFRKRLARKWSIEEAVEIPLGKNREDKNYEN